MIMQLTIYANTAFISCLVIVIVFIDYIKKFNTDDFQRKIYLVVLAAAFAAVITDFASRSIAGMSGQKVAAAMYILVVIFYITQNATYYLLVVFLGYFVKKNIIAAKRQLIIVGVFLGLYTVFLLCTLSSGFFFYISDSNHFTAGRFYAIRLGISYLPILFIIVNSVLSYNYFSPAQVYMMIFFGILHGGGAALDIVIQNSSLTWPCFAAAGLYIYFFIIQNDSKIDSLTGIGNRAAFNDFIANLSRQTMKHSYSIAMIDMNDFKAINDTFGHNAGDKALVEMAMIIKDCVRCSDFIARYGGDEFIIAINAHHDMRRLMERVESILAARNEKTDTQYKLQISYGFDCFTTHSSQKIEAFLKHIDQLMYDHKANIKTKE